MMIKNIFSALMLASLFATGQIDSTLNQNPKLKSASLAYQLTDAATGEVILEHNPTLALAPASVLKLFSTAVALDVLGGETRPSTKIYFDGTVDKEVLEGDLIIDPSFDPSLGSSRFETGLGFKIKQIMILLKGKGIKEVSGKIKILEKVNSADQIPRTWIWEDIGNYYGAGVGSTILNENILELHFKSGKAGTLTSIVSTVPNLPGLTIENHVTASKKRRDLAYAFSSPGSNKIIVTGTIPMNNKDYTVKAALPQPARVFADQLSEGLISMGLEVENGTEVIDKISPSAELIKEFDSVTLKSIVKETNIHSVNVLAEAIIAWAHDQSESTLTRQEWMLEELKKHINTNGMKIFDACGLSRFNAVSVAQINELLQWMNTHEETKNFYYSLAISGFSGTLKKFLKETDAIGKFRGKSGSMSGVRAYSGILEGKSGKKYNLSVVVNNFDMENSELVLTIQDWILKLYQEY